MRLRVGAARLGPGLARSDAACRRALAVVSGDVLEKSNRHVPVRTGALRRSGVRTVRTPREALVKWGTDQGTARYARVQYYGVGLSHFTSANAAANGCQATDHWFEHAKARYKGSWTRAFGKAYGEAMGG